MRQRSFLHILLIVSIGICSSTVHAQSNIDSLWNLLKNAQPIQERSPAWELAGKEKVNETCISGDCINGYGISVINDGSTATRIQYEGTFVNGKHHGIGIAKTANGASRVCNYEHGKEVGAYLLENNGLVKLQQVLVTTGKGSKKITKEPGFALADIQKHLANSFEKFTACNCLGRATHVVEEEYQQPYDLIDDKLKTYMGTRYKTATHTVEYPGLKNNCKNAIYIKAILNQGGYYFDQSMIVLPGRTIRKLPFNITYTNKREDVEYLGQYEAVTVSK